MRGKIILGVAAGLLGWAITAAPVSAHPPGGAYSSYYYGLGRHDFRPHWHTYPTPFGSYSYYGRGLHDLVPHGHYYYSPVYGTPNYYSAPYIVGPSYGAPGYYNGVEFHSNR